MKPYLAILPPEVPVIISLFDEEEREGVMVSPTRKVSVGAMVSQRKSEGNARVVYAKGCTPRRILQEFVSILTNPEGEFPLSEITDVNMRLRDRILLLLTKDPTSLTYPVYLYKTIPGSTKWRPAHSDFEPLLNFLRAQSTGSTIVYAKGLPARIISFISLFPKRYRDPHIFALRALPTVLSLFKEDVEIYRLNRTLKSLKHLSPEELQEIDPSSRYQPETPHLLERHRKVLETPEQLLEIYDTLKIK